MSMAIVTRDLVTHPFFKVNFLKTLIVIEYYYFVIHSPLPGNRLYQGKKQQPQTKYKH